MSREDIKSFVLLIMEYIHNVKENECGALICIRNMTTQEQGKRRFAIVIDQKRLIEKLEKNLII
jgi:hypothetical protein